ncbi:MAG: hypothetical protein WAN81_18855 [Candidatus Binataceae bacterium]
MAEALGGWASAQPEAKSSRKTGASKPIELLCAKGCTMAMLRSYSLFPPSELELDQQTPSIKNMSSAANHPSTQRISMLRMLQVAACAVLSPNTEKILKTSACSQPLAPRAFKVAE